jgi:hypothetical protein
MVTAHDMPLEDAQELHVVVIMIIVVAAAVVVVVIGGGSVTRTVAQGGVLSVVLSPPLPCRGGSGGRVILLPSLALSYLWPPLSCPRQ